MTWNLNSLLSAVMRIMKLVTVGTDNCMVLVGQGHVLPHVLGKGREGVAYGPIIYMYSLNVYTCCNLPMD